MLCERVVVFNPSQWRNQGGAWGPCPPKYLCNYGPLQEKNGHFVLGAPTGREALRVKDPKEVAPDKGPMQTRGPYR